MAELFPRRFD